MPVTSDYSPRSNTALVPNELMRSMSGTSYRLSRGQSLHKSRPNTALTTTTQDSFWTKRCETETPFRLSARVTPKKSPGPSDYGSMRTSSVSRGPSAMRSRSSHSRMKSAKSFMHDPPPSVKTMDSAGPHRPRVPSKSIPSKCSRYVLIQSAQKDQSEIAATPLEEQLIAERFPQWKEKWLAPKSPQSCIPPQPILEHPQFQQIPVNSNIPE
ncbi:hypothetical protein CAPTEDRAFT_226636 [Capitella teleta]|uniref:Uncharacterized protein n=1 Tax=Capitella teleta TaxID=283909 RepID=R7T5Z0_CAPTE|nr:hypothetical protein CAPTEDRAFT_226636 [Capitella teleta]|eukprot:ELT88653.1 hypothetical protein CAPTEDRAFT_226636 [Capitella teleta]